MLDALVPEGTKPVQLGAFCTRAIFRAGDAPIEPADFRIATAARAEPGYKVKILSQRLRADAEYARAKISHPHQVTQAPGFSCVVTVVRNQKFPGTVLPDRTYVCQNFMHAMRALRQEKMDMRGFGHHAYVASQTSRRATTPPSSLPCRHGKSPAAIRSARACRGDAVPVRFAQAQAFRCDPRTGAECRRIQAIPRFFLA